MDRVRTYIDDSLKRSVCKNMFNAQHKRLEHELENLQVANAAYIEANLSSQSDLHDLDAHVEEQKVLTKLMQRVGEKDPEFFLREAHEEAEKRAAAIREAVEYNATECEQQLQTQT